MTKQQATSRSRRQMLGAALAGFGGLVAGAVARPARSSAATGDNLVLGTENTADTTTGLTTSQLPFADAALEIMVDQGGSGLRAMVNGGIGVLGWTGNPGTVLPKTAVTGVWAGAETSGGRHALVVNGAARFSRAGRAEFAANTSSMQVAVVGGLNRTSFVLATLNTNRPGIFVRAVVTNRITNQITIYLNKAVPSATWCAWMVLQ